MKLSKLLLLLVCPTVGLYGQNLPTPLQVTRYNGVASTTVLDCGGGPQIDNRSAAIRQNDQNSFFASGPGTWTVTLNFSDTSCSGPWSLFGSFASVTQASGSGIGFGAGYHQWIQISISGANAATVLVNYSAWKKMYIPPGSGSVSFPISVSQGGTGGSTALAAKQNLNLPELYSADYNFAAQTPGDTLIASGVSQTVHLNPCPPGVSAGNLQEPLWISDGGSSETVYPTGGGTCAGTGNGTITVTPLNGHTGSWTISSGTGGIQEAVQSISTRGAIVAPTGIIFVHGPITASAVSGATLLSLSGQGIDTTTLVRSTEFTSGNMVQSIGTGGNVVGLTIKDLTLYDAGYPVMSNHTSGAGIAFIDQTAATNTVQNVKIQDGFDGIVISGSDRIAIYNVEIFNEIAYSNLYSANSGITLQASGIRGTGGVVIENAHIIMDADDDARGLHYGIRVLSCDGLQVTDPDIKTRVGMSFENSSIGITNVKVDGAILDRVREIAVQFAGSASPFFSNIRFNDYHFVGYAAVSAHLLAGAIFFSPNTSTNIIFNAGVVAGFPTGFEFGTGATRKVIISNSQIYGNTRGIQWQAGDGGTIVVGNQIYDAGASTQLFALDFSGAVSDVLASDNNLAGNLSGAINNPGLLTSGGGIHDNAGFNPVGPATLTCSGSPCTLPAAGVPEPSTLYVDGGTVSTVKRGTFTVCAATHCAVNLAPFGQAIVSYSVLPTTLTLDVR